MVRVAQTWWMAERVFVRDLDPVEGNKLLSIIRRGSGSVVRWRRSQIVLWSAQRMSVAQIAEIAFQGLRYFSLDCTDHGSHEEQASMIRRYIRWRNRHAHDQALAALVKRANVA
jgi:hypothetical protein